MHLSVYKKSVLASDVEPVQLWTLLCPCTINISFLFFLGEKEIPLLYMYFMYVFSIRISIYTI